MTADSVKFQTSMQIINLTKLNGFSNVVNAGYMLNGKQKTILHADVAENS